MQGSLCLKNGVLYVGRHAKTASVASYDLDGHALETRFTFRDEGTGRSSASGLSVDDDHRIWVADAASARLRGFTLFGREVAGVGAEPGAHADRRGSLGTPVGVVARGADDSLEILVASAGRRRHALQVLFPETGVVHSLRPLGDPRGEFHDLVGVARAGERVWACERGARRIQVFRHGDFHYAFRLPAPGGGHLEPSAVAALDDGRCVVAVDGPISALLLVDAAGELRATLAQGPGSPRAEDGAGPLGEVDHPGAVVVEPGLRDRDARVAVLDRDGERLQVFNLEGACYGAFPELPPF